MRPVRLQSAIEERAVLGVSGGVGGHERALRDHSFPIESQRFENAMRRPRSVPLAGQLLRHLRVEQGDAAFSSRLRARRRLRAFLVPNTAAASGASRVSGRTATDAWFFAHAAHRLHSVDNQIEDCLLKLHPICLDSRLGPCEVRQH